MTVYYQAINSNTARLEREKKEAQLNASFVFGGVLLKDKGFKRDTIDPSVDVMDVTRQMCEGAR